MKSILLTKRIKVTPRKHIMFGATNEGYLFVIRHLVPKKKRMTGFECFYKRQNIKICDNTFHVSDETFKMMMALYISKDNETVCNSFDVILHYNESN